MARRRYRIGGGGVGIVADLPADGALAAAIQRGVLRGIRHSGRPLARIVQQDVRLAAPRRTGRLRAGIRGKSRPVRKGIVLWAALDARARSDGARYGYILNAGGPHARFLQAGYAAALEDWRFGIILRRNMQRYINAEWRKIRPITIDIKLFA